MKIILYFRSIVCKMSKIINISIVFLVVLFMATSCTKFAPLERLDKVSKEGTPSLKSSSSDTDVIISDSEGGITDTENDEDYDVDGGITDTENDEDHDTDVTKGK